MRKDAQLTFSSVKPIRRLVCSILGTSSASVPRAASTWNTKWKARIGNFFLFFEENQLAHSRNALTRWFFCRVNFWVSPSSWFFSSLEPWERLSARRRGYSAKKREENFFFFFRQKISSNPRLRCCCSRTFGFVSAKVSPARPDVSWTPTSVFSDCLLFSSPWFSVSLVKNRVAHQSWMFWGSWRWG